MEAHARAAIDIYGRVLRYAEVEQYGSRYRLLRLGSCDFDFDVSQELHSATDGANLSTVSDALREVFSGSVSGTLVVTIHSPLCYSFFSPLPASADSADREVRLQQEAAVLAGSDRHVRITADAVHTQTLRSGEQVDWVHVLAIEEGINQRIDKVAEDLPPAQRRVMVGMHAAASAIGQLHLEDPAAADRGPFMLAIGWYAGHVEYTLCHGQQWYFSKHTTHVPPVDVAYFVAAMLDQFHLSPSDVGRIRVYGNAVDVSLFSDLGDLFELDVRTLNPLGLLDLDPGSLASDFEVEAYVGCIGAAL